MTTRPSTDERIARWLDAEAIEVIPDRVLERTFERTRSLRQDRSRLIALRSRRGGRALLLLAAAVAASLGISIASGALRQPTPTPRGDVLDQIVDFGRIRIVVRPDQPQFTAGNGAPTGFDTDVATALGSRIGVRAEITFIDAATMLEGSSTRWDVALPSVPSWTVTSEQFSVSKPYYFWPHRLVVAAGSSATSLADVVAGPICVVSGDAGEQWLRGAYGSTPATPVTTSILTAASDEDCLARLSSGAAVAMVTAQLSDADLQIRSDTRVIGGPAPEPRAAVVPVLSADGRTTTGLLSAINGAISAMRADGTLTGLSQNRFGGTDLSQP